MFSSWQNSNLLAIQDLQNSSHMLSQVVIASQTNDRPPKMPGPPFIALCCTILQLAVFCNSILSCSLTVHFCIVRPSRLRLDDLLQLFGQRATHLCLLASSPSGPDGRPPIGDTAPLVCVVRRPLWSMAIAICPTATNSSHFLRKPNGAKGVNWVSFGVDMLTICRETQPICLQ